MNLANSRIGQLLVPIDDFEKGVAFYRASELWLAEFTDPDGNQLALMSDVAVGGP